MANKYYSHTAVGGSNTHVVLEFPAIQNNNYIYMGSLVTVSYQVHRDKTPVFNCGSPLVDGFAIGNKFVAGSMITTMFSEDELALFQQEYQNYYKNLISKQKAASLYDEPNNDGNFKPSHTFMTDDLTRFNVHIIFANEYEESARKMIIYDANFINSGRVMSIEDIVTETTYQFVARTVKDQYSESDLIEAPSSYNSIPNGTNLLRSLGKI